MKRGDNKEEIVMRVDLPHVELTQNARQVLAKRYLKRDQKGNVIEEPEDMFWRVAENIASANLKFDKKADVQRIAEEYYSLMASRKFMPNSPTLMNAGRELQQLSACFVLPIEDSMDSIFDTLKHASLIHKSGGGTGFSFSRLRPANDTVMTTKGVASGPISFMKVYNAATEVIKQGGVRRGANMGILRVDHSDILSFITCKESDDALNNFNISVAITEEFMKALKSGGKYELINPKTKEVVGKLSAREVFNLIVKMAWKNGEPGIVFLDRINRDNPTPHIGEIESTNPCGEQPLLPYESCNLGSINLSLFVKEEGEKKVIDYDELRETVHTAVRFLDDVIEMNRYPLPQIDEMTKGNRKIGLGVMGWADALIKLGIPYDDEEAIELAKQVMKFIRDEGRAASSTLAEERGVFPNYKGSIYEDMGLKLRNATITTIAPTGTISMIAGCSSGIEPLFALAYVKHVLDGAELIEVNPLFKEVLMEKGLYDEDLMRLVAKKGSVKGIPHERLPEEIQMLFRTAHDIAPEWHVKMQAAFQEYTDNAVSKTVNLPHDATEEDVAKVYFLAYELGCKGLTVYRDGSRESQVLTAGIERDKKEEAAGKEGPPDFIPRPRPRPEATTGITKKVKIGCGNLYVTVNHDDNGICEIFSNTGRYGGCPSQSEAMSRLISISLRAGMQVEDIVEQLKGIRCPACLRRKDLEVLSCPDAIARVITEAVGIFTEESGGCKG
jgi:ribonucleoside-diphosphate reductase alpha chain